VRTDDFDYELPKHLIAQHPIEPRDSARLLVLHRQSGQIDHRSFAELGEYVVKPDCLVVNETRVLPARLRASRAESGGAVEVLLLRERWSGAWEALVKPGRRVNPGEKLSFDDGAVTARVVERIEGGGRLVQFPEGVDVVALAHRVGEVPLPPYISEPIDDPERYQTVFARSERSAAAPTAGLHFTEDLLGRLDQSGVALAKIELDVGVDTFRPVTEETVEDHPIHKERYAVSETAAHLMTQSKERGGRIVCVGTTSVRAVETAAGESGSVEAAHGQTDLFIYPGYRFKAVDALVTNFHLPRTTLLMLVCAFAGRDLIMGAYQEAVKERYRFFSFGDAMLIL
jgi:S-adenosylmethionine:tRNA ribosyltransferase-isomerase